MKRSLPWLALLAVLPSCSSSHGSGSSPDGGTTGTQSVWVAPSSLDQLADTSFYDHPWPSDLRRDADGSIHVTGFYNPYQVIILQALLGVMQGRLDGFSTTAAEYVRFTDDVDTTTLPVDPPSSTQPTSSVQLVDVDPTSPEHGKRKMIQTFFWPAPDGVYWIHDTLSVMPALGHPLRAKTKYALVVTSALKAKDGSTITPSGDLAEVLDLAPVESRVQPVHDLYAPAVADLASTAGIPASSIVHLAVFTTNDPTSDLFAVVDDVHANVQAPTVDATTWTATDHTTDYDVYEGVYGPSPNYQQGTPPYNDTGEGGFVFTNGKPVVQNTFTQQFALVIPNQTTCPMPAAGYPIVLYGHGTGGYYRSIVEEGNSFGDLMAQHCLASIGINQIFSGNRPGSPPGGVSNPNYESTEDVDFFNVNNFLAMRTNGQQGAVDFVQLARLFTETKVTVPSSVSRSQAVVSFDVTKVLYIGHSEGGQDGPLFLAADDQTRGGVLSGSGAMLSVALLEKTSPPPAVSDLVKTFLDLKTPDEKAEMNLFHPVMGMAQTVADVDDPVTYASYIIQSPRPGHAPKSILQTEGVNPDGTGDTYAPPHGIEIHSVALGLPRQSPGVHTIAEAAWSGPADVTVPAAGLQGNLAGGAATGALGQFVPAPNDDGHFVAFDVPAAHAQIGAFCQSLAAGSPGTIPPLPQ